MRSRAASRGSAAAALGLAAFIAGTACAGPSRPAAVAAVPLGSDQAEAEISAIVQEALERDAGWTDGSDLYGRQPVVIADGERRYTYPMFAAIDSGGQVGITSSRVEIGAALAWAFVEYRWLSPARGAGAAGYATFVLSPTGTDERRWTIVHAHSSTTP